MTNEMLFSKTRAFLADAAWQPWRLNNPKRTLYHYTTAAGLHGIVSERKLRLTHTRHLNDETEGLHGVQAVDKALDVLTKRLPDSELFKALSHGMKTALLNPQIQVEGGTFVGCFSTVDDSLSQWRGYGHHDSAFCLAFDASELYNLARASWGGRCWLLPVEYGEAAFVTRMEEALTIASEEFEEHEKSHPAQVLFSSLILHIAHYGSALKHSAFEEEQEWRLILLQLPPDDNVAVHHLASATFRPYAELEMGQDLLVRALERVIVGPQSRQAAIEHGVLSFLKAQLGADISVERSKVPFNARV